jgi:flagellar assembly protein FliH
LSKFWGAELTVDAAPVAVAGFRPVEGGFRSLYTSPNAPLSGTMRNGVIEAAPDVDPIEDARMEAFTLGFDEGCRVTAEAQAADAEAVSRLAEALELLSPAPSGMLSTMLSATVVRLVEQIVGEVEIDMDRLVQRCDTVAAFIESNQDRSALHVHPEDAALLKDEAIGVPLVADKGMQRGCVRLETADGWVEDGPDVRLARLRALMDDMEGKA